MGAADFVQEMRWVGQRLLLKLQRLPQAEPVEIVAFSVILLFTGQPGSQGFSSALPGTREGGETMVLAGVVGGTGSGPVSPRQGREADGPWGKVGGNEAFPLVLGTASRAGPDGAGTRSAQPSAPGMRAQNSGR